MKKYGKKIAAISGVYALILFVMITLAYVITDGDGWDMLGVIFIAIFSVPVFIAILGTVFFIDNVRKKHTDDLTPKPNFEKNAKFEKVLGIITRCLSIAAVAAVCVFLFSNIDNNTIRYRMKWLRDFAYNVCPWIMIFASIAIIAILLDRPITKLILKLARKKHPETDLNSRGVMIARVCCMVAGLVVWPALLAAVITLIMFLGDVFTLW